MTDALMMTETALETVVKDCLALRPNEACGFVLARHGERVGFDVRPMRNVDPEPARNYTMDDQEVLAAYAEFDLAKVNPVAVYHSHVDTAPLMSEADVTRAFDTTVAYLIVSLAGQSPRARAYRVSRPFIGVATQREVNIQIGTDDGSPVAPDGPWALTPGNDVIITYSRPRVTATSQVAARVVDVGAGAVALEPIPSTVVAGQRNVPASLPFERIKQVEVLKESPAAVALRRSLVTSTRLAVATLRDREDIGMVPNIAAALAEAFPTTMRVVVRTSEEN